MTLLAAFAMTATGCSDFLEREPLAQGTEAIFFQNAEQFEQAANEFYNNLDGWKDKNVISRPNDNKRLKGNVLLDASPCSGSYPSVMLVHSQRSSPEK